MLSARFCLTSSWLVLCCAVSAAANDLSTVESTTADAELHPVEVKIIDQTNALRKRHGLARLTISINLVRSARQHTSWMCRNQSLVHTSRQVGENIATGQQTAAEALRDWMNSPGHRANILNPRYTQIGVAAYRIGQDGAIYWCQQFLY